jgi:hypothetical protein
MRSVTWADGKPFFVNRPELHGAAEKKIQRPLFAAVVRIAVQTEVSDRSNPNQMYSMVCRRVGMSRRTQRSYSTT